mmetsp:Transcript_72934/g.213698  ORF Transcript_72934/g.213698 Transcript_72934/m.213698 type:complete len:230 (-) Transcript_72934:549-1238(-)
MKKLGTRSTVARRTAMRITTKRRTVTMRMAIAAMSTRHMATATRRRTATATRVTVTTATTLTAPTPRMATRTATPPRRRLRSASASRPSFTPRAGRSTPIGWQRSSRRGQCRTRTAWARFCLSPRKERAHHPLRGSSAPRGSAGSMHIPPVGCTGATRARASPWSSTTPGGVRFLRLSSGVWMRHPRATMLGPSGRTGRRSGPTEGKSSSSLDRRWTRSASVTCSMDVS